MENYITDDDIKLHGQHQATTESRQTTLKLELANREKVPNRGEFFRFPLERINTDPNQDECFITILVLQVQAAQAVDQAVHQAAQVRALLQDG